MKTLEERFWSKVAIKGLTDCWAWESGTDNHGYGLFWYEGRMVRANRISLIITGWDIPEGFCALHTCDNPICVNPNHLFIGTKKDNVDDMIGKGRCCSGEKHPNSKLTKENVLYIRESSSRQVDLAKMFGISVSSVSEIKSNKRYKL